ncbi:MAG: twin-arginine translocase subunit TatC [Akkermansiaceae bacterium]|nr:twin-arginine translocase subunit TatC [Akkermansiaceae bacterium]
MSILKKIISLREQSDTDQEKPFLEHLEDLRKMIFRIVITLIISMVLCFSFQGFLLDVLRRPIQQVWDNQVAKTLPDKGDVSREITVELWDKAKEIEQAASKLVEAERQAFYASLDDPDLVFHARSVALLRAAKALPDDKREDFIRSLKLKDELTAQVLALIKTNPETEGTAKQRRDLTSLKPTETFMLSMKLAFIAGILLALPLLIFFVLQFVLPGLHDSERKALWPALAIGTGLFLSGVCFAYFVVLRRALDFFAGWSSKMNVVNEWRIGEYISFATNFTLLFGVAFELPVVVMLFVKLGLLSYDIMSRTRRYAIVGIFVLAAIITPTPDVMTLFLMALPMLFLYECCIWLAWLDRRKQREREAQEAKEHQEWLERRAQERREAAERGELSEDGEDEDPYPEDYRDDYHDEYDDHDPHEYDPYHDDDPEDYNWDEEYEKMKDAGLDGEEEDESALDEELGKSAEESEDGKDKPEDEKPQDKS